MTNIHTVNLKDYELETREELAQQITDCENAIRKLRAKKWDYQDNAKALATIEREMRNYENEADKLSVVLELIDNTGRGY